MLPGRYGFAVNRLEQPGFLPEPIKRDGLRHRVDIHADPPPLQLLCGYACCGASGERIDHKIALIRGYFDDAPVEFKGFCVLHPVRSLERDETGGMFTIKSLA